MSPTLTFLAGIRKELSDATKTGWQGENKFAALSGKNPMGMGQSLDVRITNPLSGLPDTTKSNRAAICHYDRGWIG
ncbi:hypothetical protein [Ruegeria arenilitoris]|uniref:hypothetical protein n=1 Tax=Ruegeria arenilitoris TaxID=1173585 RepID=UPI00147D9AA2|nr:hypothetical protein [Ruegeria arenilitoris]